MKLGQIDRFIRQPPDDRDLVCRGDFARTDTEIVLDRTVNAAFGSLVTAQFL